MHSNILENDDSFEKETKFYRNYEYIECYLSMIKEKMGDAWVVWVFRSFVDYLERLTDAFRRFIRHKKLSTNNNKKGLANLDFSFKSVRNMLSNKYEPYTICKTYNRDIVKFGNYINHYLPNRILTIMENYIHIIII